jgi:hypothetical protein
MWKAFSHLDWSGNSYTTLNGKKKCPAAIINRQRAEVAVRYTVFAQTTLYAATLEINIAQLALVNDAGI